MIKRISHFALHQPLYIVLGLLLVGARLNLTTCAR